MSESRFEYVTYIRSTAKKIWQGLTDPEITRRYWLQTWQECEWKPGASWRLMIPDGRVADSGEVIEIEPDRRLVLSWRNEFLPKLREEGYSRMTCDLQTHGDAVKLTVVHVMDRPDSPFIAAVSSGWPALLSSLKSLLETGEPLDITRRWPVGM